MSNQLVYATTETSKRFDISPTHMTYSDLASLIANVNKLLQKANFENDRREEVSLSLSTGEDTININGWNDITKETGLPMVSHSVRFRYNMYDSPVSNIEITLTDAVREISIKGSDSSQVQAISSYLKESLTPHHIIFGGDSFRTFGGMVLFFIAVILVNIKNIKTREVFIAPFIVGLLIMAVVFIFPWSHWFPGVAIYAESASFIDRNINIISFVGVIFSILIPIIGFSFRIFKS